MQVKKDIAIIFFSLKASQEGQVKKILSANCRKNEALSAAFINRTEKILAEVGLPVFRFDQNNQKGNDFGHKLANAYQEIFDLGYQSVIAVGNDSPELVNTDWEQIQQQLTNGKLVIGPTLRGGTYLIGLSRKDFEKEKFATLSWQTNSLFSQLKEYGIARKAQFNILRKIRDINTYFDLKILIRNEFLDLAIKKLVLLIIALKEDLVIKKPHFIIFSTILLESPFRAPPFLK